MRTLVVMLATSLVALAVAGTASAAPTLTLTWTGTTGTGTTGGSAIDASVGDVLTLQVAATDAVNGISFVGVSLGWNAAALTGAGAIECPNPPNLAGPGICTPNGGFVPPFMSPLAPGVTVGPGSASSFDAAASPPSFAPAGSVITVGQISFTVQAGAGALETVNITYVPGLDSVNDGLFQVFFPTGSATVVVPEPGTAGLMGLGLLALGAVGRRRN